MKQIKLKKEDIGWNLSNIEKLAFQAQQTGQHMDLDLLEGGFENNNNTIENLYVKQ